MAHTREDKIYFEGWHDGYVHALDDVRQELLTLEADTNSPVAIEEYKILNFLKRKLERGKNEN